MFPDRGLDVQWGLLTSIVYCVTGLRDGHPDGKENACLAEVEAEMEIHGNTVKDLKANNSQVTGPELRENNMTFVA
jgi:hypothetical protein